MSTHHPWVAITRAVSGGLSLLFVVGSAASAQTEDVEAPAAERAADAGLDAGPTPDDTARQEGSITGAHDAAAPVEPPRTYAPPAPVAGRVPTRPASAAAQTGGRPPERLAPATPTPTAEASSSEPILTVVGTPLARTAGSAHVVSEKQLERFEHDDPHAVLGGVPGVYFRGEDGMGLRPNVGLRGVNPDRSKKITWMEDGVLFGPAPYSAPAAYYVPVLTRMTEVRVVKGPAAVSYGPQTIGGAIDLVTRSIPVDASGGVDAALGTFGYRKAHAHFGSSGDRVGGLIEGVHLGSDGFKELPGGGDTGFYRNEWMFKGAYVLDPDAAQGHELRLKLTYSEELSNETYLGLTDADFEADPLQRYAASALDRMRNHRTSVVATHFVELARPVSLTTDVYRHDFSRVWRKVNGFRGADLFDVLTDPETPRNALFHALLTGEIDSASASESLLIGPNERDFVSQGVQTRLRWEVGSEPLSHRLEVGVRLHHDRVERRHSEDAYVLVGGEPVPEGTATTVTAFNEAFSHALAAHATDAITWEALTVTPGVRVETIRSGTEDRLTGDEASRWVHAILPGVGAFYAITRDFGLLAGAYRGFSPPEPGSDDSVEPESSVNYEGGARYARGTARAEAIGFYNDYGNLTDVCTLSSGCTGADLDRQFDAGQAAIYGVEAFVGGEIPLAAVTLPLTLGYTFTQAELRSDFVSADPIFGTVERGDEMPYVPRHQFSATIGIEHARAGGNAGVSYVSAMREQAGSEPLSSALATDEQFLVDVSAYAQVIPPIRIYATARNLLDAQYIVARRPFGARPNAPRLVLIGTKVNF